MAPGEPSLCASDRSRSMESRTSDGLPRLQARRKIVQVHGGGELRDDSTAGRAESLVADLALGPRLRFVVHRFVAHRFVPTDDTPRGFEVVSVSTR